MIFYLSNYSINCDNLLSRFSLPSNESLDIVIDYDNVMTNLTILSKINSPFSVMVYDHNGKKHPYKGIKMNHIGYISYLELINIAPHENKIKIIQNQIMEERTHSTFEIALSFLSILIFALTIFYDKSNITKVLIFLLLVIELYNSYNLIDAGNKIKNNIIRLK